MGFVKVVIVSSRLDDTNEVVLIVVVEPIEVAGLLMNYESEICFLHIEGSLH